jgi:hypothetical protein
MEESDISEAEYRRSKADIQAQLDALRVPDSPAVEEAGETLQSLGAEWATAPRKHKRDMLNCIFELLTVDVKARKLLCVEPYPPFVPLFRLDGLEEKGNGCFYYEEWEES